MAFALYAFLTLALLCGCFFLFCIFPERQRFFFQNPSLEEEFFYAADFPLCFFERENVPSETAKVDSKPKIKSDLLLHFSGGSSCKIFAATYWRKNDGKNSCAGFGDCAKVCEKNAILIQNGEPVVLDFCTGCGKCADVCPFSLIKIEKIVKK